ncbi:MAG TPA: DUF4259 domain-containing protein [Mycobacteriales bacterium]|nr:DUF4259 domain-containing protein [Mycobacteriales bacterium]
MGAWDTGPFDNDGAADWCGELQDADPADRARLIRAALASAVDEGDYLDVDVAQEAVAAAAVVASQRVGGRPLDSAYAPDFLRAGASIDLSDDVIPLAVRALDRIVGENSEWRDLWQEGIHGSAAFSVVATLRTALAD